MDVLINVVLLLTATALAVTSFFGKAWDEDKPNGKKRITVHGVVSVGLWLLALGFGITKEVRTKASDIAHRLEEQKSRKDLTDAQERFDKAQAAGQLETRRAELEAAKANGALEELRKQMGQVQHNLNISSDNAARQSAASLITALANSDQKVTRINLDLPFTRYATKSATLADEFLPSFKRKECRDFSGVGIYLKLDVDRFYQYHFALANTSTEYSVPKGAPSIAAKLFKIPSKGDDHDELEEFNSEIGQSSWNGNIYHSEEKVLRVHQSAAVFISDLTSKDAEPLVLESEWPLPSNALVDDIHKINQLYANSSVRNLPPGCSAQIGEYFGAAFDKAALTLVLDQKQSQVIIFHLKRGAPYRFHDGNWGLPFTVSGPPIILAEPVLDSLLR
jgi:Skp family chaperone for outer membrane proteins